MTENSVISKRYDFVYFFDCHDGNPNGDPDSDNSPRFDPETFQGLVTDVCIKRKIRDYVFAHQSASGTVQPGYGIFVMSGSSLEKRQQIPYNLLRIKAKTQDRTEIEKARAWMCGNFFDVRAFGAVMSTTDFNCGQVRGPVQMTFARSLDRIFVTEHTITRVAYTREKKFCETSGNTEIGKKHTVAYGLYRAFGYVNASFAPKTGFHQGDLDLVWKALGNMWDLDRSAARGHMSARALYVFEHSSALGEAQAHSLFNRVSASRREGVESPRGFDDYLMSVQTDGLPAGVRLIQPWN